MNEREPYLSQINEILNLTKDYKETCDESEERRLAIAVIAKTRHLYKDLMAPILHHADEREGILTVLDRVLEKKNEFEEATDPVEIDRLALEVLEDFQFIESSLIGSVCQYAHGMFWSPLGEIEITPEAQRDYFVDILKWELPLTQEMRYSLVYGFRALNAGETPPLFSPTTTGNRHKKYTITAYQMMALLHIERIAVEEGITKEDAKKIVAAEYVKETDEIEKWRDRFDDFKKERLDRWLDFVRRTAPLAKKLSRRMIAGINIYLTSHRRMWTRMVISSILYL